MEAKLQQETEALRAEVKAAHEETAGVRAALAATEALSPPSGVASHKVLGMRWEHFKWFYTLSAPALASVVRLVESAESDATSVSVQRLRDLEGQVATLVRLAELSLSMIAAGARAENLVVMDEYWQHIRSNVLQPSEDYKSGKQRFMDVNEKALKSALAAVASKKKEDGASGSGSGKRSRPFTPRGQQQEQQGRGPPQEQQRFGQGGYGQGGQQGGAGGQPQRRF
ncbi:MAG: hypothetical protein IM665_08710 [Phenylobacterium sp.]|nr:hypothetical protein [Phenylobacterium sp.]